MTSQLSFFVDLGSLNYHDDHALDQLKILMISIMIDHDHYVYVA